MAGCEAYSEPSSRDVSRASDRALSGKLKR